MSERGGPARLVRVATSLHTYTLGGFVHSLPVHHYGHLPLFLRGYMGPSYSLGTLRTLLGSPGTDLDRLKD